MGRIWLPTKGKAVRIEDAPHEVERYPQGLALHVWPIQQTEGVQGGIALCASQGMGFRPCWALLGVGFVINGGENGGVELGVEGNRQTGTVQEMKAALGTVGPAPKASRAVLVREPPPYVPFLSRFARSQSSTDRNGHGAFHTTN